MYVEYVENKNSNVVENYIFSRKFVKLIFLIELIKTWFFSNYVPIYQKTIGSFLSNIRYFFAQVSSGTHFYLSIVGIMHAAHCITDTEGK